jgi:hypothetical protein
LPADVQEQARRAYLLFASDSNHPSLRFKRLNVADASLYSVRVSRRYRAIGTVEGDTVTWIWIGSHADYDREIAQR